MRRIVQLEVKDALPVDGGKVMSEHMIVALSDDDGDDRIIERFSDMPIGEWHEVPLPPTKRKRRKAR